MSGELSFVEPGVALLAITRDPGLYDTLWEIASEWKWAVCQQCDNGPVRYSDFSLIVLDGDLGGDKWKEWLRQMKMAGDPCVLLASRVCDQYLREEVVRCGGFDVLAKSDSREHLTRTLRFAWLWKKNESARHLGLRHAR